jgi:small subunit ribosomal protein S17
MQTQAAKPAAEAAAQSVDERGHRRRLVGVVTSDKMEKTVVVMVTRRVKNEKFGKFLTKRAKYKAHSPENAVHVGDKVLIIESRPLSKDKRWRVEKLLEKARRAQ